MSNRILLREPTGFQTDGRRYSCPGSRARQTSPRTEGGNSLTTAFCLPEQPGAAILPSEGWWPFPLRFKMRGTGSCGQ